MPRPKVTKEQAIEMYVDVDPFSDGCWEWTAATNSLGYGVWKKDWKGEKENWYAHRLAWTVFVGPIPDDLKIRHLCHNPLCCRIGDGHLMIGTQDDNIQDSVRDGRILRDKAEFCPAGHEYSETAYYRPTSGSYRECVICLRERNKMAARRRRAAR